MIKMIERSRISSEFGDVSHVVYAAHAVFDLKKTVIFFKVDFLVYMVQMKGKSK